MLLYGAGGHAKVIIECLHSQGQRTQGIFDDASMLHDLLGVQVLGIYSSQTLPEAKLIIAIGNNRVREQISRMVQHQFGVAMHRLAYCSEYARVGAGTVIMQNTVIQPDARIGQHGIINTAAIVEHDCVVGDFVHIAPNATLCGHVEVGTGTLIGAGAVVTPCVKIGQWATIHAGASVTADVPDFGVVR